MPDQVTLEVDELVSLLDELKLSEDTIFVFSSDNGATMPGTALPANDDGLAIRPHVVTCGA